MTNTNSNLEPTAEQTLQRRSRRAFLTMGVGAVGAVAGWRWLMGQPDEDGVPAPFRRAFDVNQRVTENVLFGDRHLAPEFPPSAIRPLRVNGDIGVDESIDLANWKLELVKLGAAEADQKLDMAAIRSLPKVEFITEFKCVEGWSTVMHWGGVRLRDFTAKFAPGSEKARYVGMETPDEDYYVGLDMPSALHPQTLLAYERDGKPLEEEHGAPLRLVIPVKYGIKNIKRIGRITYSNERPADYWAEQGYDYYAAL